ncbi:MAG: hypothetical protein JW757_02040 [Anaerolineales bacterium]|nr:hypothetical protein [Anaerolineales bacterium]
MEDSKITIIEGPTPTFEVVYDTWANGIVDGSSLASVAVTRLRTANGHKLVERCYRAWNRKDPIHLEFRGNDGLPQEVPIVAAQAAETDEGDVLLLWVRLSENDLVIDFVYEDDEDFDDFDDYDDDDFDDDDDYDDGEIGF